MYLSTLNLIRFHLSKGRPGNGLDQGARHWARKRSVLKQKLFYCFVTVWGRRGVLSNDPYGPHVRDPLEDNRKSWPVQGRTGWRDGKSLPTMHLPAQLCIFRGRESVRNPSPWIVRDVFEKRTATRKRVQLISDIVGFKQLVENHFVIFCHWN